MIWVAVTSTLCSASQGAANYEQWEDIEKSIGYR